MFALEFLTVGAWGFWIVLLIGAIIASELLDNEKPGSATFTVFTIITILSVFGNFNPIAWIKSNPVELINWIVGYLAIGAVWGVIKWYAWLTKSKRRIVELRKEYPNKSISELSYALRSLHLPVEFPPKVSNYKSRIIGWMSLWPASIIWTAFNDPVRWLFEEIYDRIGGLMQAISNRVFKDFEID